MKELILSILYFVVIFIALSTFAGDNVPVQKKDEEQNIGDIICGPKSVCKILRWYGKDEDVIRAIREIQYPDIQKGATLSALSSFLEKRDIHIFAVKIKPSVRVVSLYPAIIHLKPQNDETLGHYVVWLPNSRGSKVIIWDGDKGIQEYDEREWSKSRSGAVLLTSLKPIDNPNCDLKWVGIPYYDSCDTIGAWFIFIFGIGLSIKTSCFAKR